jgi:hypothetical protein
VQQQRRLRRRILGPDDASFVGPELATNEGKKSIDIGLHWRWLFYTILPREAFRNSAVPGQPRALSAKRRRKQRARLESPRLHPR